MGTAYKLYDEKLTGELDINEASNKLELLCWSAEVNGDRDLLMMKIFLAGIKVCSYWMSQEEFKKTMDENFEEYSV